MDQINNLQGGQPKPISPPVTVNRSQGVKDDADKAQLSFEALVAKLQEMPEIRVEAMERGRELMQDADYPGNETLNTLAQNLISQRIV
jgi:hypothetical protein